MSAHRAACPPSVEVLLAAVDRTLVLLASRWSLQFALDFEDLVQDARTIIVTHAANFDPAKNTPQTWAKSLARGAIRDTVRDRVAEGKAREQRRRDTATEIEGVNPMLASEERDRISQALNQLPPLQARLIRRHYGIDGPAVPSLQELADLEGLHRSTVGRQIASGEALLRRLLSS